MAPRSARPHIVSVLALVLVLTLFPGRVEADNGVVLPLLEEFASEVSNGEAGSLRGIYVPEVFASRIVLQPKDDPTFVSSEEDALTEFALAHQAGSTGLLAHNYLAGRNFSKVKQDQVFYLVYGDGRTEAYIVTEVLRYKALDPQSVWSYFVDLRHGNLVSASRLFSDVYGEPGRVVLQTCIFAAGDASWGRLFIIAEPFEVNLVGAGEKTGSLD